MERGITFPDVNLRQFGWNKALSTGTVFRLWGGTYQKNDGTYVQAVDQNVTIASGTNYVELDFTTGVVSSNQVGFTSGRMRLWIAISNGTTITGKPTDWRARQQQSAASPGATTSSTDEVMFFAL